MGVDVYRVRVVPEDDWWAADITGPRLDLSGGGTATEAASFSALEDEVRDVIVLMTNRDADMAYQAAVNDFDLDWDFSGLPQEASEPLVEYLAVKAQRSELEKRYLALEKAAAIGLADVMHASHRDAAAFMGLSHSRVAQVLKGHPTRRRPAGHGADND
jgi:hypothetical protein